MKRKLLLPDAKIGIINRGEAAVRFIRGAKEFNALHGTTFTTVAFYTDVESDALFVKEADQAYALSSFPEFAGTTGSPYLNMNLLINALLTNGCTGVWVGWGFVAENAEFAALLEKNGLVLLGPTSKAMDDLGDKIKAKEIADKSKVPTCPWSGGFLENVEHASRMAEKIGYPVILKSANGGGGRGIRKVFTPDQMEAQFRSVSDEIFRFFGNRVIFMEALVVRGRHLEVQCLADSHGNVHTFGVRDCSVQRNNQKIIEETPPAHLAPEKMKDVEASAARLLTAAGYHSAGTVEYLYDIDRKEAYFMEVNTRLQVEHPITEELFQVDFIHLQLRVAMGEVLSDIPKIPRGHVIEVRLNAEDPDQKFAPTPGRINRYLPPLLPGIRIDSGFEWGSRIPGDFDSMVAKIIASGPTRASAVAKLRRALSELQIEIENGTTNQGFLLELLSSKAVQDGGVLTDFVEGFLESPERKGVKSNWDIAVLASAVYQYQQKYKNEFENFTEKVRRYSSPRQMPDLDMTMKLNLEGNTYQLDVHAVGGPVYHVRVNEQLVVVEYVAWGNEIIVQAAGRKYQMQIVPRANALQCEVEGIPYNLPFDTGGMITAPSPSVVLTVNSEEGQKIKKGELLLTLEAMKMEMAVTAPEDGTVMRINVKAGEQVSAGQALVDFETESQAKGKEGGSKLQSKVIDFSSLIVSEKARNPAALQENWEVLARNYVGAFTGFDYAKPAANLLHKLDTFVQAHPEFKKLTAELVVKACTAFISVQKLFQGRGESDTTQTTDAHEYLMHYLLRRDDREKGLPAWFLDQLKEAIKLFAWADQSSHESTTRALFHLYKASASTRVNADLLRQSLLYLQTLYPAAQDFTEPAAFTALLDQLIQVAPAGSTLMDAAVFARYDLVDRLLQDDLQIERQSQLAEILTPMITSGAKDSKALQEVIDSGHQLVTYLVSLYDRKSPQAKAILEIMARRFNRDRKFTDGKLIEHEGNLVYQIRSTQNGQSIRSLVTILTEAEYFESGAWLKTLVKKSADNEYLECLVYVRRGQHTIDTVFLDYAAKNPLDLDLYSLGIVSPESYVYHAFHHSEGKWQENKRRQGFSPLRFRELRIERLENFNLELLYNSRHVHVVKLEAKTNAKDQRLFAFVEIPEPNFEFNEAGEIEAISQFEFSIQEAAKVIREQQARHKRSYFWNRIVAHLGHAHPLRIEQVGQYPERLIPLIQGLGLEKLVLYTRVLTKSNKAVDTEVLVEDLSTHYTVRGRQPSPQLLAPLDPYTSKVVNALRLKSPYPYEVVGMLTKADNKRFPKGRFVEFDVTVNAEGQQTTISVEGRAPGLNTSNVVFGRITNETDDGQIYDRVLVLGDPTRDLGSLAEGECRRVMAALDMAEAEGIPMEWVPISSGAAIDMNTGTENLDWTARVLRRLIEYTQAGGEVNIIVAGVNVGAQAYWNAEATMLMHTKGILIMTDNGAMVLTGKRALDFSGSVSAEDNIGIGGVEGIMGPNGQAQFRAKDLSEAYSLLFRHYRFTSVSKLRPYGTKLVTHDPLDRDVSSFPYHDKLNQGFTSIGDILGRSNAERKKPFDMRQVMQAVRDQDADCLERWQVMRDAETAIVWETTVCGFPVGLIGIESRTVKRIGEIPNDGPDTWTGGTLYPQSSKKVARAINAYSNTMPVVVLANLSGFDGSPESLRRLQLEYGAEIGRAAVNFKGPLVFIVVSRYHGGAYVVFSKTLNPNMRSVALEATYASVIGGAPAAAVVFPRQVLKNTFADPQLIEAQAKLKKGQMTKAQYDDLYQTIHLEQQAKVATEFEKIHTVERALKVGSIDAIISAGTLRAFIGSELEFGVKKFTGRK
ncbi:MAG: carboxyl transferase domain-containing protein [Bdellovibrionota bacterium]